MLWVLIYVVGGQCGDINAHWNAQASTLGLGIFRWFGSFATWLRDLYLYVVWWHEAWEVGCEVRYVSPMV